jgi:lysophospholipase L1-like esterase
MANTSPRLQIVLGLTWLLFGCGGGGGSSDNIQPTPVPIAQDASFSISENAPLSSRLGASVPSGVIPEFVIVDNGTNGTAVIDDPAIGAFTYVPGSAGSDSFTFRVNRSNIATVSLTIAPNQPPLVDPVENQIADVHTPLNLSIRAVDPDGPSPLFLSVVGAPTGASFVDQGNGMGSFDWTPRAEDVIGSPYALTFTAMDGAGLSASRQIEITVQPLLLLSPVADRTASVGEQLTFDVIAADPDGPPLALAASGLPSEAIFVDRRDGSGTFSWTPSLIEIANSPYAIDFTASAVDDPNLTETITVEISVQLTDNFSNGADSWVFFDDITSPSSSWEVAADQLVQQQNVGSRRSFTESYHRGTYAYLAEGFSLTDYRFEVDAASLSKENASDIGIMFRYQDNGNYYRLSLNGGYSFARLEKKVDGRFLPLAVNGRGYIPNQPLRLAAEVKGNQIRVYVDDARVFSVQDDSLLSGTVAVYTQGNTAFDRVTLQGPSATPSIAISSPPAFTTTVSDQLQAQALVPFFPLNGEVEFRLNGLSSVFDTAPPFQADFERLTGGNYTLEAILRDGTGKALAQATSHQIGVSGEYLLTIGDSITNGIGDRYWADNFSQNGRIRSIRGHQATLVDLLESSWARPVIVYNNAIGGDRSIDAAGTRIDSILARHPGSGKALVMLGTNDSRDTMSGTGCFGDTCSGTFKGNMLNLISTLNAANKTIYIARIPPVFGSSSLGDPAENPLDLERNQRIQAYNDVIDNELPGKLAGPDFFGYFLGDGRNRFSLYSDPIHLNSLGYVIKSYLWHNAINPAQPEELPFILENLTPSAAPPYLKQNLLQVGNTYYVDDGYKLTDIPLLLQDGIWIQTANANVEDSSDTYIEFEVDRAVRVYVAYDTNAVSRPSWMNGFQDTGMRVGTDNPQAPQHAVFSRDYPGGAIQLGGNKAVGAAGASANYIAIVKPL